MKLDDIKLLYVEDEDAIVQVMQRILKDNVAELHIAKDGEEALESYKKNKPDIILADINIPKLNGLELISKIRETDQKVKVIMLTAHSDKEFLIKAAELKLTKYLIKPIVGKELFEALNCAVEEIENLSVEYKKLIYLEDDFIWDINLKTLTHNNEEVRLTPKEKAILEFLFDKQNSVVSYDDIIYTIWEDSDTYSIDTLKSTVKSLRKKLPKDCIKNVYGTGYKIEV